MQRMFLIPEDFYNSLLEKNEQGDGTAIGLIKNRLQNAVANNERMDPDSQAINYEQNLKRFNKLLKEKEEKPINVNVKNFSENLGVNNSRIVLRKRVRRKIGKKRHIPIKIEEEDVEEDGGGEEEYQSAESDGDPKEQAMDYLRENANILGVLEDGRLARKIGNDYPLITSNVEEIVNHIIRNRGMRTKKLPTGYDEFIKRINDHPILQQILFPESTSKQKGSGVFCFKPSLWKIPSF